jgi:hypothetical protein
MDETTISDLKRWRLLEKPFDAPISASRINGDQIRSVASNGKQSGAVVYYSR